MELAAWQDPRRCGPANRVSAELGELVDACCRVWNRPTADTARLVSLTDFAWARPNPETLWNWYERLAGGAGARGAVVGSAVKELAPSFNR